MTNVIDVQQYKTRYHKRILSTYLGNIDELSFLSLRFYFNKCGHELVELYNQKDNKVRKYEEEDLELAQKIDELNLIYNSIKNKYKEKTNE